MLVVVAVAVCTGAMFLLLVPCVCVRELLLLGVTATRMMVLLTVWIGGGAHRLTSLLDFFSFFSSLLHAHMLGKKANERESLL
ncbi:trans-sialidase [Trypanosoma cruzi Dm28c]|uniref:Trans-sialidase n=1 Tax=Trypanosoma cruzi Dm28c TaxID=1416333 RepID=V5D152_TRYCR|nr:trans-sialidase [Trypanosoma cruzi Dm28c]